MKTAIPFALVLAACQPAQLMTPAAAEVATYKALANGSQGTAWAVAPYYLLTAGHMCADDGETLKNVALQTADGYRFAGQVVEAHLDDTTMQDICLIKTDRPLAKPFVLADKMPAAGAEVWYAGYPMGEFVKSVGQYVGTGDGRWNQYVTTAPCDHGASGSAMFTSDGVFGILVRLQAEEGLFNFHIHEGEDGCVVTPLADIQDILKRNGVAVD